MSAPRLLFCSPVLPSLSGNGLAMRAGTVLRALATRYRVSLLVVPLYWSPARELPPEIAGSCQEVVIADEAAPAADRGLPARRSGSRLRTLTSALAGREAHQPRQFSGEPFDVVHVFRLALVDKVGPWLGDGPGHTARHLDLDDIESSTRGRLADLYQRTGRADLAPAEHQEAALALTRESEALRSFDRVYVCSEGDRLILEGRRRDDTRATIEVLPNALEIPTPLLEPLSGAPFTFLFVATLGYAPNEDAIVWFCREVLPRLRRMSPRPFRVIVAGTGATPTVLELAAIPEVEVLGAVPSIADCYASAHASIVPIRAGGGTRIKILEAFAYRRPVVTTSVGAEGIEVQPEGEILIGDAPADFARQCARLIVSPELCARLADRAETLFRSQHSLDALIKRVQALP